MALGAYLKEVREKRELSLRDVEAHTSISSGHLSMIEQGKVKEPSARVLHELADFYDLSYIDLMKRAGYLPQDTADRAIKRTFAFRGAEKLSEEQRERIQRQIDFEVLDIRRRKGKQKT